MGHYDAALICLNRHVINSRSQSAPEHNAKFCDQCGEEAISKCPDCDTPIRGAYQADGVVVIGFEFPAPKHCHNCGEAFPWTKRQTEALTELLDELEGLSDEERAKLEKSIPDILAETPGTSTAVLHFKKLIAKLGVDGSKALVDILKNIATEHVRQQLGI